MWTDILTWRQHVFTLINGAFQPLLEVNSSVAYIGHHEAAWTINRCTPAPPLLPPPAPKSGLRSLSLSLTHTEKERMTYKTHCTHQVERRVLSFG